MSIGYGWYWESVLKNKTATEIAREYFLENKTDKIVDYDLFVFAQTYNLFNKDSSLEQFKEFVRESLEKVYQPDLQKKMYIHDSILMNRLKQHNAWYKDIDWEEITPFALSIYDKGIDRLKKIPGVEDL